MKKKLLAMLLALVIAASTCVLAVASQDNKLRFGADGKFTILQIADPQDGTSPSKDMLMLIKLALNSNPDLVVFTGDNVEDGKVKNDNYATALENTKTAIGLMLAPVIESGIPFTCALGNNDHAAGISAEDWLKIYQSYDSCIIDDEISGDDRIDFNIEIFDTFGDKPVYNLWIMDTGRNDKEKDDVTKEQIKWYESECKALASENGGETVPALVFQHMPVAEFGNLYERCAEDSVGALASGSRYYRLNPALCAGEAHTVIYQPGYYSNQFSSWKAMGDVTAMFCGHTHQDGFYGIYDGIGLGVTYGAQFAKSSPYGARVITLNKNDTRNISTSVYRYSGSAELGTATLEKQSFTAFTDEVASMYATMQNIRAFFVRIYVTLAGWFGA